MALTVAQNQLYGEIYSWFFEDYLPRWISAGAQTSSDDSSFIADYWGHPLHISTDGFCGCMVEQSQVVDFLHAMHERLRAAGYAHTNVPDKRIIPLSVRGGAIEVIWSRCRADGSEIERIAVHFQVVKKEGKWKVLSFQSTHTNANRLADVWQAVEC